MKENKKPIPGPTPPPPLVESSEPHVYATQDDEDCMEIVQEFLNNPTAEFAETLWHFWGLYPLGNYKEKGLDIINLILSQPVVWLVEDDEKLCKNCEELAVECFILRDLPQQHPNCRCGLNLLYPGRIDVTEIVLKALRTLCHKVIKHPFNFAELKELVEVGGPWDLKLQYTEAEDPNGLRLTPWEATLGVPYPGKYNTIVIFNKMEVTLEWLGNFTYGYIAFAMSMGGVIAISGSVFVSIREFFRKNDFDGSNIREVFIDALSRYLKEEYSNEFGDHPVIGLGQDYFIKDLVAGIYDDILPMILNNFIRWLMNERNYIDNPNDTGIYYG